MSTKNKTLHRLTGLLVVIMIALSANLYFNPYLNMADLFNAQVTGEDAPIYMPSYEATPGVGQIEIMAGADLEAFDSMTFVMDFEPATALTFSEDPLVTDASTVFQNFSFQETKLLEPGRLEVTLKSAAPVSTEGITSDAITHKPLFKLETTVSDTDASVLINFDEVALMNADTPLAFNSIPPTLISVQLESNDLNQNQDNNQQVPEAPMINVARSYASPSLLNPGDQATLYAFVEDDDILQVVADVAKIGYLGDHNSGILGQDEAAIDLSTVDCSAFNLPTNKVACMQPNVEEPTGRWYILQPITIQAAISAEPYLVPVHVTDLQGHTVLQNIPVYVGMDSAQPAKAVAAVATSQTTVEVLFNKPLDPDSVAPNGAAITVTSETQVPLAVSTAVLNAEGNLLTLNTGQQLAEMPYALTISDEVTDVFGQAVAQGNALEFQSFAVTNKSPVVDYLTGTDMSLLEVEFESPLKLSSILNAKLSIYKANKPDAVLDILSVEVLSANTLLIKTATQEPGQRYRLRLEGLASADATLSPVPLERGFKGTDLRATAQHASAAHQADLNGDLKIDFADFTIFSYYYGRDLNDLNNLSSSPPVASGGLDVEDELHFQTITEDPDALVPVTSEI